MNQSMNRNPLGRNLNPKQHAKLDRMADGPDPEAVVTGWSSDMQGPFITSGDGTELVLASNGHTRKRQPGHQ